MSTIEKLLAYQEEDAKLFEIEKMLNESPARKNGVKAQRFLRTVGDSLASIDAKAQELNFLYENCISELEGIKEDNAEFTAIADKVADETELNYLKDSSVKLNKALDELLKKIVKLQDEMNELARNYTKLKKETVAYQEQYEKSGKEYAQLKNKVSGERKQVEDKLKELAVGIPEEFMKRYLEKRKDKVFPILYAMSDGNHCPHCGTELSLKQIDILKRDNSIIECENCRQLLFLKK